MVKIICGKTKDGKECNIYIDGYLKKALDKVKHRVIRHNWDYVAIVAGIPGCLTGDTKIKTLTEEKTLKELSNQTVMVKSYDFENKKKTIGKARVYPTGRKQIFEIETTDGKKVKATAKHTFFIQKENKVIEVKLKDLKEGDELICENRLGTIQYTAVYYIKKIGKEETYDLRVYPHHNFFLANGIVVGNSGKSTLARTIARYCDYNFTVDKIAFTAQEFISITNNTDDYSAVVLDESFASLNSRVTMSPDFLRIINHLQLLRQKHLFIILCLPNFFDLSKGIAVFRTEHLFVTYAGQDGRRGSFKAFSRGRKTRLYVKGGKYLDYNVVAGNFKGAYTRNNMIMSEDEYETKKRKHLLEQEKQIENKKDPKEERNKHIFKYLEQHNPPGKIYLTKEVMKTAQQIFGLKPHTLQLIHADMKKKLKKTKEI